MAMLAALCAVTPKEKISCIHIEHALRPAEESQGDADFVSNFCRETGIECKVVSIPPGKIANFARRRGIGIEASARFFRRRALFKEAARLGGDTVILTAHTKDDMLETALMRVLRGAGPAGLAAMPVSRGQSPRRLLRPIISLTRADVISFLKEKKIPWREDSSNTDEKFLRNRVRRRLVPLLNEHFPSWKSGLSGMAQTQSLTADFLAEETKRRVVWRMKNLPRSSTELARSFTEEEEEILIKTPCNSVVNSSLFFTNAENFFAQPQIIREEAVFQAVDRLFAGRKSSVPVKRSVIRRFCSGGVSDADLGKARLCQKDGKIVLSVKKSGFSERGFSLLIKEPGLYNLKKVSIEVLESRESGVPAPQEGRFFAALPLVFRRSFKDDFLVCKGKKTTRRNLAKNTVSAIKTADTSPIGDIENAAYLLISAIDRFGTAAFISEGGVLFGRDKPQECDGSAFYFVSIKRGNDV